MKKSKIFVTLVLVVASGFLGVLASTSNVDAANNECSAGYTKAKYMDKIKYSYNENYSFTLDNNYKIELERIFLSIIIDKILNKNDRGVHFYEFIAALIINIYYQITKEEESHNKFYKVTKHLIHQYVRAEYKEEMVTVLKSPDIRISDINEEFEYLSKHREDN